MATGQFSTEARTSKQSFRHRLALTWIVTAVLGSCAPTNFELSSATIAQCSADDVALWNDVVTRRSGIKGADPAGNYIANFPAERSIPYVPFSGNTDNWRPLSAYKQTLCGELHHFNTFGGGNGEMDWNNFFLPTPAFQYLIDEALPYKGGSGTYCVDDDWHSCVDGNDCLEAEITPDQSFFENPWFAKSLGESPLEGLEVCTYGPWVRECFHGHRPEIHPSELIWWKERFQGSDLYWLMGVQDDSNRFDEESEFDIDGPTPPEWRPWARPPMTAQFGVAFEVDPARIPVFASPTDVVIGEAFALEVVTAQDATARPDSDNGTSHAIEYDGEIVLTVNETQPNDDDLGVRFTNVCRREDDTLQGYVTITTKFGTGTGGGEGYHVLYVTITEEGGIVGPVEVPGEAQEVKILARALPDSLTPEDGDGTTELHGAIEIEAVGSPRTEPEALRIESVTRVGSEEYGGDVEFEPAPDGYSGRVSGLRLTESYELELVMGSGERLRVSWPALSVTTLFEESVRAEDASDPASVWSALVTAAGEASDSGAPPLTVARADLWELTALPLYALVRDGRTSLEEGSPFAERLNETLANGTEPQIRELFATDAPISIAWSFEATDLATGATVPVVVGSAEQSPSQQAPQEIRVELDSETDATARIAFPPRGGPFELQANMTVQDVFGNTTEARRQAWSHFLSGEGGPEAVDALLRAVARVSGTSAETLIEAGNVGPLDPDDPRLRDPELRRAQLVHAFAETALEDGRVTVEELRSLFRGAALLVER